MRETKGTPRLAYIDPEDRSRALLWSIEYVTKLLEMIREEPGKLAQTRHSSLADRYSCIARFSYALGYSLADAREAYACAALAELRVAELRGTEDRFPVVLVAFDPSYPPGDPRRAVEKPAHPPGSKDYSLGNSQENFGAVTWALTAGEFGLARQIASRAWDPPKASYVGLSSEVCTPNDQRIAYAVKHLFVGEVELARAELDRVRPNKRETSSRDNLDVARMVRALAGDDRDLFLDGLRDLLAWHDGRALRKQNHNSSDFFLCLPGLGLSALALHRNLIARDQLPDGNPFFPLDLLDLALSHWRVDVAVEFRVFDLPEQPRRR
jgi:hypothetical protein